MAAGKPGERRRTPRAPPHDVIAVRFEWDGGSCFIQKSMPAAAVPRRGDTVTVLTKHAVIEGDVHRVWWVLNEGDPGWEYIAGPGRKCRNLRQGAGAGIR